MRHYVLPATRKHDAEAWAALVSGAIDLAADPIPEDDEPVMVPCPYCGGLGYHRGYVYGREISYECTECTDGKVPA